MSKKKISVAVTGGALALSAVFATAAAARTTPGRQDSDHGQDHGGHSGDPPAQADHRPCVRCVRGLDQLERGDHEAGEGRLPGDRTGRAAARCRLPLGLPDQRRAQHQRPGRAGRALLRRPPDHRDRRQRPEAGEGPGLHGGVHPEGRPDGQPASVLVPRLPARPGHHLHCQPPRRRHRHLRQAG